MTINKTNLNYFRILCCIGVLIYHVMDDILNCGWTVKAIYFSASYCVPGFFLLSGFLLANKKEYTLKYTITKSIKIMLKLLGWITFFSVLSYFYNGKFYNIFYEFYLSAFSTGILPVGWFLFTYCALIFLAYPIFKLLNKNKAYIYALFLLVILLSSLLGLNIGLKYFKFKTQSTWVGLYFTYFCIGICINYTISKFAIHKQKIFRLFCYISFALFSTIYAYQIFNSVNFFFPDHYYGKFYYTGWLISLFYLVAFSDYDLIPKKYIDILSKNTLVVYLAHLPILLFITNIRPITSLFEGLFIILIIFILTNIISELCKRLPLLNKLL